jgi:hypothetical protein
MNVKMKKRFVRLIPLWRDEGSIPRPLGRSSIVSLIPCCLRRSSSLIQRMFQRKRPQSAAVAFGAGGGNRTRMEQAPLDFESSASTYFTTPAGVRSGGINIRNLKYRVKIVLTFFIEFVILNASLFIELIMDFMQSFSFFESGSWVRFGKC